MIPWGRTFVSLVPDVDSITAGTNHGHHDQTGATPPSCPRSDQRRAEYPLPGGPGIDWTVDSQDGNRVLSARRDGAQTLVAR